MPTKKRNKKLNNQDKKLIEEIVRVDHAGEHGATQIYRGQLAIFNKNTDFGKEILEMAEQEEIHKTKFDESPGAPVFAKYAQNFIIFFDRYLFE